MVKKGIVLTLALALTVAWGVVPVMASPSCPIQIGQAEGLIKKAEASIELPETKALLAEAKKFLAEAKSTHDQADTAGKAGGAQPSEVIRRLMRP
jgi:hypothetical protein